MSFFLKRLLINFIFIYFAASCIKFTFDDEDSNEAIFSGNKNGNAFSDDDDDDSQLVLYLYIIYLKLKYNILITMFNVTTLHSL